MRLATLIALPVSVLDLVLAVPSPAWTAQAPIVLPETQSPWWKRLQHNLVEAVYGRPEVYQPPRRHQIVDSRTLAQYGGDVVLRFNISTEEEAAGLRDAADTLLLDIWEFAQDWVDIRLASDLVPSLLGLLPNSLGRKHVPLMREADLVRAVFNSYPHKEAQFAQHPNAAPTPRPMRAFNHDLNPPALEQDSNAFFRDYQPMSVIQPWMRLMSSLFNTHVRMVNIGKSYEGRNIPALRIGVHPTNDDDPDPPKRKTFLITGGSHAREWISISTVNYIAYTLIVSYGKSPSITKLLQTFDFVFVPTINPDGYAYSWTTDRFWRKNRQPTSAAFCHGIDLDRSFGYKWDARTSDNPCSESFAGSEAFEAVESRALADWAKNETQKNNVTFIAFLDLHSYSQSILYPYSFSCSEYPPGLENLEELAYGLEKAIRMSAGHTYEVLPACEGNSVATARNPSASEISRSGRSLLTRMEASGGAALDWFYHELKVPYAYQMKLRDRGTYGFLLPKENIIPTGKEILDAVLEMSRFFQDLYGAGTAAESKPDLAQTTTAMDKSRVNVDGTISEHDVDKSMNQGLNTGSNNLKAPADASSQQDMQWELRRKRR